MNECMKQGENIVCLQANAQLYDRPERQQILLVVVLFYSSI
jgi:hypothetical protein